MARKVSPCLTCTRVRDPRSCENKSCVPWQKWFLERWEATCNSIRTSAPEAPSYLASDPCLTCPCAGELCAEMCQQRLDWQQARQDTLL